MRPGPLIAQPPMPAFGSHEVVHPQSEWISQIGSLTPLPCWVEITRNGRFLFTVNTAVPSISSYAISPGGSLRLLAAP
jgi:hypothetical protein